MNLKIGDWVRVKDTSYTPSYIDYDTPNPSKKYINTEALISLDRKKVYKVIGLIWDLGERLVLDGIGPANWNVITNSRIVHFDPDNFIKDISYERKEKLKQISKYE